MGAIIGSVYLPFLDALHLPKTKSELGLNGPDAILCFFPIRHLLDDLNPKVIIRIAFETFITIRGHLVLPVGISGGGGREERHFADVCLAIGGRVGWGLRVCKCLQNYVAIRPGAVQLASKVGGVRRKSGLRAGKRASLKRPDEGVDTALGREKKKAEDTENEKHGRRKILK